MIHLLFDESWDPRLLTEIDGIKMKVDSDVYINILIS